MCAVLSCGFGGISFVTNWDLMFNSVSCGHVVEVFNDFKNRFFKLSLFQLDWPLVWL